MPYRALFPGQAHFRRGSICPKGNKGEFPIQRTLSNHRSVSLPSQIPCNISLSRCKATDNVFHITTFETEVRQEGEIHGRYCNHRRRHHFRWRHHRCTFHFRALRLKKLIGPSPSRRRPNYTDVDAAADWLALPAFPHWTTREIGVGLMRYDEARPAHAAHDGLTGDQIAACAGRALFSPEEDVAAALVTHLGRVLAHEPQRPAHSCFSWPTRYGMSHRPYRSKPSPLPRSTSNGSTDDRGEFQGAVRPGRGTGPPPSRSQRAEILDRIPRRTAREW